MGPAATSISNGTLRVQSGTRGGEAVVDNFAGDDYMIQVRLGSVDETSEVWFRYQDSNNGYMFQYDKPAKATMKLYVVKNGQRTELWSGSYSTFADPDLKIKADGTSLKVWYDGTLELNVTDGTHAAGGVDAWRATRSMTALPSTHLRSWNP